MNTETNQIKDMLGFPSVCIMLCALQCKEHSLQCELDDSITVCVFPERKLPLRYSERIQTLYKAAVMKQPHAHILCMQVYGF